jgi:hypothetical protein
MSLLSTPYPTPLGKVYVTPAIGIQTPPRRGGIVVAGGEPLVEGAVRMGVHERADVGLKVGPLYLETNSVVRLAGGSRWILSVMPGLSMTWLWEAPGESLGHAGSWHALGSVDTSTRVSALRLPLLFGWHGPRDRLGLLIGPTVHAGYRDCRNVVKSDPQVSSGAAIHTCIARDTGGFLGVGGHVGVQIALGTFVKLMPELGLLGLPMAPPAREVYIDEPRQKFSRGDLLIHFAMGVQLGRFVLHRELTRAD